MRAAVMRDGRMLADDVADPTPGPGQVLARTLACGICGSDLHAVKHLDDMIAMSARTSPTGEASLRADQDIVMGHEFCVEILDYGPGCNERLATGSHVCSMPVLFNETGPATIGYSNAITGGYAELMVLSEALLLPVPNGLAPEIAALTEPLAVGRHAVEKAQLREADVPLVIGCGPVGLAVIAALRQQDRRPIIAADFSPARRRLAETMGADIVIDPAEQSPYASWADACWPEGADRTNPMIRITGPHPRPGVVFECVGVPGMINAVMDGAMRGTKVVVVGVCMQEDRIEPLLGISKEIDLRFVLGYTPDEFADTLRGIAEGDLPAAQIITGEVDIDGVPTAFADLADPEAHAKIMVRPQGATS